MIKGQNIDNKVCCEILAKKGDHVNSGDSMARLYCQKNDVKAPGAVKAVEDAFLIGEKTIPNDIVIDFEGPIFPA